MPLLGILEINEQFFIKIDNSAVLLRDVKYLEEAVAFLVAYYYILNLKFPPTLKFMFGFFERLFEIEPTAESVDGKKLHGFLLCNEN